MRWKGNSFSSIWDLVKEIKELQGRIRRRETVLDSVSGSCPEFPFDKRVVVIEGLEQDKRLEILRKRIKKCEQLKLEIEQFIATIPDSRTRRVFEMRYFYGYSWQKISAKLHGSESYARMIHDRYLDKK